MERIMTRLAIGLTAVALTLSAANANILPKNDSPDPPLPPRMKVQPPPAAVPSERHYFTASTFDSPSATGCDSLGNAAHRRAQPSTVSATSCR
jgi:hypothetical protein